MQGVSYDCAPTLYGDLANNTGSTFNATLNGTSANSASSNGFFLQIFRRPSFVEPLGLNGYLDAPNPFYFAVGARVTASDFLLIDPEDVEDCFIFACSSSFYELEYKVIDGTVVDGSYVLTDDTLPASALWTFQDYFTYIQTTMSLALMTGAQLSNNSQILLAILGSGSARPC
jgi:hypothetical protein